MLPIDAAGMRRAPLLLVALAHAAAAAAAGAGAAGTVGLPAAMRAAVVTGRSPDSKFHLDQVAVIDMPVPVAGPGEVLVQVQTSNLNPVDHKVVEFAGMNWSYPHKLGFDVAGVVLALGEGSKRLRVGDEVWGEVSLPSEFYSTGGTFAQYAALPESRLGVRPRSLSWLEAGAMPMVALTGYESLTWAAGGESFRSPNTTVLVLGGSGGTGHLGIQLAKAMGAQRVVTTCSGSHAAFVRGLGADEVIDYTVQNFWEVLPNRSVDVVYDCVGLAGTGDRSVPLLKQGGAFVTLLAEGLPSNRTAAARPDVRSKAPLCVGPCSGYDRMDAVKRFVAQGLLKVCIQETHSLADIRNAFNHSVAGHTAGKIALQIAEDVSLVI